MRPSAIARRNARGFTLVELMIVVAIIGVLASLAIYGVSRYLASAKSAEAKNSIGAINRGAVAAFERENMAGGLVPQGGGVIANVLCNGLAAGQQVPAAINLVSGQKFQSNTANGQGYQTGTAQQGWRCLKFAMSEPQFYQYNYAGGAIPGTSISGQSTGAAVPAGVNIGVNGWVAEASGDLDGDTVNSYFALGGIIQNGQATTVATVSENLADELSRGGEPLAGVENGLPAGRCSDMLEADLVLTLPKRFKGRAPERESRLFRVCHPCLRSRPSAQNNAKAQSVRRSKSCVSRSKSSCRARRATFLPLGATPRHARRAAATGVGSLPRVCTAKETTTMSLDHYITLGHSGLRVSPFCLGTMTFGEDWGWGSSVKESEAVLDRYLERGGNFIDTANAYTRGHSEKIIGDHLGRHSSKRERVVIATKFGGSLFVGDPNGGGGGRKSVIAQCDESLRRLQTDYIDLYWMHHHDKFTPIEETMAVATDLVRQGKVRYVGFSDTPAWKVAQAQTLAPFRGWAPLIALQIEYSLLERTVEGELVPMARELGLGVTPWSPLKSGALSGKYTRENHGKQKADRGAWAESALDDHGYDVIDELIRVSRELDSSPARVALAWVQMQPGVASTIIGARTLKQLDENLAALDVKLSPQQVGALNKVSKPKLDFPAAFLAASPPFLHGGTTVNGERAEAFPLAPKNDSERY